jgi:fatty-acyl-CoA synthase
MIDLSYAHGGCSIPLLGETISQNLRRIVDRFGDNDALIVPHQNYRATYRQLWEQVDLIARGLLARGVQPGDRVGVWSPNRFEWVIVQFAAARLGAILVTVNPAFKAGELKYALNRTQVTYLALAKGFRQTSYLPILDEAKGQCPHLRQTTVFDTDWEELLGAGQRIEAGRVEAIEAKLGFDDPICVQYTSGTTGQPKGATLTHHNILNNAYFVTERLRYTDRDRVCVPVPFYHCFGMVVAVLGSACRGACSVIPAESFDPGAVLKAVETYQCTSLYGVPTMFVTLLNHPELSRFNVASLRTGLMGGAPCPPQLIQQVQTTLHMPEIGIICGMTETSPASTQTAPDDPAEMRQTTVGRPHSHVEIKIIDPLTGAIVPCGTTGEQCMRGYHVMPGYWDDPAATAAVIDAAGWMHSGDLAVMDAQGYVRIVGRIKDVIIKGGENVYPREVEEFLQTIPGVAEAQVIGVPCATYGEVVVAWIKPKPGATLTAEELYSACAGKIATFKIPQHWKFVDAFPSTLSGKAQKFKMREISSAELRKNG